jgi:hypothetical protein
MERVTVEGQAPIPASSDDRVIHHRIEVDGAPAEMAEESATVARNYEFNEDGFDDPDRGG